MIIELFQKINDTTQYLFGNTANESEFLKKILQKNLVYVDIGANNGFFYKKINKILEIKKSIIIEPSISAYNKIKMINKNDIKLNIAISSCCKKENFMNIMFHLNLVFIRKISYLNH